MAHHLSVPYDTSALHVPPTDWSSSPPKPIKWKQGVGMELGKGNFERIVTKASGGFCYANNTAFAALLRGWGFKVSEVGARVYLHRGKDPEVVGYNWSAVTHETLLVDWEGSDGRYLVDVGFGGGGCPYPIFLRDGQTQKSLSSVESFYIRAEPLPLPENDVFHPDVCPGFTFYRRVLPNGMNIESPETAASGPGYWTPCYHFTLSTLCPTDIIMANYYNESHPNAVWATFFAVSRLLPTGARQTLTYGGAVTATLESGKAKLYKKDGINGDEFDIEWVDFDTKAVGEVLRKEFGYRI